MWTLQWLEWLQCQWEKTVEERRRRRRHCQQWGNCREEMECAHQDTRLWLTVLRNGRRGGPLSLSEQQE